MNLNKSDIIYHMACEAEISQASAKRALESLFNVIGGCLQYEGKVSLVGFGSFSAIQHKPRLGRNPKTGESVTVKARKAVRFVPGLELRKRINSPKK